MVAVFFITLVAVILRFVVIELAKTYSFWTALITPFNIVMWVMIGVFIVVTVIEIINKIRGK